MLEQAQYMSEIKLFQTTSENPVMDQEDFFVRFCLRQSRQTSHPPPPPPPPPLIWQLIGDNYRVFFLNSYPGPARKIICEVRRMLFVTFVIRAVTISDIYIYTYRLSSDTSPIQSTFGL